MPHETPTEEPKMTNNQSDPLHQHCLEVAEKALPCPGYSGCDERKHGDDVHWPECPAYYCLDVAAALEKELRAERERVLEALQGVEHTVEFYLKREIESPANHQEFAREASEKLDKFREAIRKLKGTGL
jgi:hypothetical protein